MRVHGVGPGGGIAIVGPWVGREEDRTGIPFSPGNSDRWVTAGDELNRFLESIGVDRDDIYLDNLYQDYKGKDYEYTAEEYAMAAPALLDRLARKRVHLVVAMGREVARLFLGDVDITDVESLAWHDPNVDGRVILPMVHVAAGLRNSDMSPLVVKGFQALNAYLAGDLEPRALWDDPYPNPVYEEITSADQLDDTLAALTSATKLSLDTEGWPGNPWSLQYSHEAGTGYLIRATRGDLLQRFIRRVRRVRPTLVFQSALHDLSVGRSLGTDFDGLDFEDTAVQAYLLQLEPRGLKAGCLRNCNMAMSEYMDVLGDVSDELARQYLTWLYESEQVEYEEKQQAEFDRVRTTQSVDKKTGLPKFKKDGTPVFPRISKLPSLPKTQLHKAVSRVLQSKRPRTLWEDQIEDVQVAGYNRLGAMPEATLDYVEPAVAIPYGCRDADGTGRLRVEYGPRVDAAGLRDVYQLELATYPLIDRMARIGIKPDLEHFAELSGLLQLEIDRLKETLELQTGRTGFNANSGDQVAGYLFDTLGLDEIKVTSSGRGSTNDKILEALENEHPEFPEISDIRAYRETYKLKNTFTDRVPDFVNRWPYDGRVHTTFRTTTVVTGRLAASDPNLLAMPKHGAFAKDFRRGWVVDDGHVFGSWDLSQIELRIAAHLSQDPVMLAIYRGEKRNPDGSLIDLHAALAQRIFGVEPSQQDDSKHRLPSKAINFGFWMGQTAQGLQVELRKNGMDVSIDDAQRWLDDAHSLYTGAQPYMDRMAAEAEKNGFIRCLSGRIRYIGGIRSRDERVREEARRFAFSTPIQEGAQTVMKTNEAVLWNDIILPLRRDGYWIEPIVQIHDDIVLEMQDDIIKPVAMMMVDCMTQSYTGLSVPIKTSSSAGRNWCDMDKVA